METSTLIWVVVAVVVVIIIIALIAAPRRKQAGRQADTVGPADDPRHGGRDATYGAPAGQGAETPPQEGFGQNEYREGHHDPRFTGRGDPDTDRDGRVDQGPATGRAADDVYGTPPADPAAQPPAHEGFGQDEYREGHYDPRFTRHGDPDTDRNGRVDPGYEERRSDDDQLGTGAGATSADADRYHDGRVDDDRDNPPPRT